MMRSRGESKTRCRAIVASTTPRFDPKWPPVARTRLTMAARHSEASSSSSSNESASRSRGPVTLSRRSNAMLSPMLDDSICVLA